MIKDDTGAEFRQAYASLNAAQKEAVDNIEGPVMVIAGPGTGKTQILALRIANILDKTDTAPESILAMTFTDAGAHAMRERLTRYIGDDAYKVAVHTFHSFAGELIRKYPDSYPEIIGGRVATDIEKLSLIEELLASGEFKLLRPTGDPLYYAKKIPAAIADLKKEYITPDILASRIDELEKQLLAEPKFHEKGTHKGKVRGSYSELEKRINKLRELNNIYRLYQVGLRERRLFDYEDMIVETVKAIANNQDMLRDLQETYQYILADEHQDVNNAQNKILEQLADYHESPNIFVVGDEKQAIYRFQGASLDNFLFFQDRFRNTKVIQLTDNYRSTQSILDVAGELIETDDDELRKLRVPLMAAGSVGAGRQELRYFNHQAIEDEWLVKEVQAALDSGTPPEEIAVITRYNRDVEHFANLLRYSGISVQPSAESDILEHPLTKAVENLLRAVIRIDDESALFDTLLGPWWKIPTGDLARMFAARNHSWPLYRLISDEDKLAELKVSDAKKVSSVGKLLEECRGQIPLTTPHLILHRLVKESGLLDHIMEKDALTSTRILRRLYDDIEAMVVSNQAVTLRDVVIQLEYRRMHNLPLTAPFIGQGQGAVQVMTAHKSKGLEFQTVIIPRVTDKAFGKATNKDNFKLPLLTHEPLPGFGPEDDDRRLLYVAMTRAKQVLLISASETGQEGRLLDPSRFLSVLNEGKLPIFNTEKESEEFKPEEIFEHQPTTLKIDQALLRELFLTRGFSVTHLNNYLEDPLKYYNENLLRRPHPRGLSLLRGEAVHEVLERAVGALQTTGKLPRNSEVSDWIHQSLAKLPIGKNDIPNIHEQAFAALVAYLPSLEGQVDTNTRTEFKVKASLATGDSSIPEIPLTGNLDRVDYDSDGNIIRVTDYKTGKAKSKNEVEGLTKSSNGNYKRQLVFYALLLQLYDPERVKNPQFILSFVEPKESSGEIVEYAFTVSKKEIEELKVEVIKVAKEIVGGEFFN